MNAPISKLLRTCAYLLMLASAVVAHAQTARFTGQVTDAQNAAIPNATVQVTNLETGSKLNAQSDGNGQFTVPYLAAGRYQIDVSADGFGSNTSAAIVIGVGQAYTYNVHLGASQVNTQVEVATSNVATVETQNAEVSGTITGKEVTAIGLNGRNFVQFIDLVPGVSNQTQQDEAKVGQAGSVAYSVNGGRTEYNSFSVDGSETLNTGINKDHSTLIVTPSIDAIQEIKVLTSNYGAQYPSNGNGTTIVTTKSGTDSYHGNVYEFLRNEALNAKGYFDVTNKAPLYRRNDFGGTIGGPLSIPRLYNAKGKTYLFFSEEARIEKTPTAYRQAVPSLAERNDDFSDVCPPGIYSQFGQPVFNLNRNKYPDCPIRNGGTAFLAGRSINRNAKAILDTGVIPFPNATSGCNSTIGSCYNVDISLPTYWREELFRIDHTISPKLQASFRYIHDEWDQTTPVPPYGFVSNSFPTIQSRYYGPGTSLVARLTATVTPNLLNEFVVSYTQSKITLRNVPGQGINLQRPADLDAPCAPDPYTPGNQCPLTTIFNNGATGLDGVAKIPAVVIAGNNAEFGGVGFGVDPGYIPWTHTNPVYTISDNVTKIAGRHSIQFGALWSIYQRNQDNTPIGAATGDTQGVVTFNNVKNGFTGNSFADFLYWNDANGTEGEVNPAQIGGGVFSFQQDSGQARYRQRFQNVEPYIQDDFKATPHLTINAGLRLSLFGMYHTSGNNVYNWNASYFNSATAASLFVDPSTGVLVDKNSGDPLSLNPDDPLNGLDPRVFNGLKQCGAGGVPGSCMSGHLFNLAPRIGAAWDVFGNGKTALRGGYGIFFEHGTSDEANTGSLEGSSPVVLNMTALNPLSWSNIGRNQAYPLNVTAIPLKAIWPYTQQWSGSIQQALPSNTLMSLTYVGSKGTHLTAERQLNQLQPLAAAANPFGAGRPLIRSGYSPVGANLLFQAGDCTSDGTNFVLLDGQTITPASPAFINMQAACFGTTTSNPNAQANVPGLSPDPNALRQFAPGLGEIYSLENVANSAYNAFQMSVRHISGGSSVGFAYTYSHSFDNASDRSDSTFVNSYDLKANRASSNFDQRHLLHISYTYQLPFVQFFDRMLHFADGSVASTSQTYDPAQWPNSHIVKNVLGGWELSGITAFETGIPFSVVNNGSPSGVSTLDNAGVANGQGIGSYPDRVGSAHTYIPYHTQNSRSVGPLLLNPAAFAAPAGLSFGTAGRNSLNNPRRTNWDTAVLKNIALTERMQMQFRAEAFNVFNQTQFRIYDPLLGNQAQNTVSCYGGAASGYSAGGGDGADCLTGSSFLHPVDAHRPRTIQFGLKLAF